MFNETTIAESFGKHPVHLPSHKIGSRIERVRTLPAKTHVVQIFGLATGAVHEFYETG